MSANVLSSQFNFTLLSLKDLIEARDLFHVHLMNKANVLATAVGKYLIRFEDIDPKTNKILPEEKRLPPAKRSQRTLFNSTILKESWPCILVYIDTWVNQGELTTKFSEDLTQIIPKCIYMPDGRIVPICVVAISKNRYSDDTINEDDLVFPENLVGGGFPLKISSQGVERVASVGCVVNDGNKYYALTNKHVVGDIGQKIYTEFKGKKTRIGKSSAKQLKTLSFEETYKDWPGENVVLNADIGLIEIDDLNQWKTDIFGIGTLGPLADFNVHNLSLSVVGVEVSAFGAVSGKLQGEIRALFYRYKSVGGYDYIADFLIGPRASRNEKTIPPYFTRQGDSGTLWVIDEVEYSNNRKDKNLPLALQWGQQRFLNNVSKFTSNFSLATCLSNVSRILEVDIVRDWNLDQDYSWGKVGHFKIGAYSCELVSDPNLSKLLMANQKNIGYEDTVFLKKKVMSGKFTKTFVPLADVADIYWRSKRPNDKSNHFADMDESSNAVMGGKNLLELCTKDANIDIDFWLNFYGQMDTHKPIKDKKGKVKKRLGALPFRVWQMYLQMIRSLANGNVDEFICAGGTMSHYVGDACQSLHISYLHHGENNQGDGNEETGVHADYETKMLEQKSKEMLELVNSYNQPISTSDLVGKNGKDAARRVIELMRTTFTNLPPIDILNSWRNNAGSKKISKMWDDLGERTGENIAEGAAVMAILWQSAWKWGNGNKIPVAQLKERDKKALMALYQKKEFVPSYFLDKPEFKAVLK